MRLLLALALVATTFAAGCASGSPADTVRSVYGSDVMPFSDLLPSGVAVPDSLKDLLVIGGYHLEGMLAPGAAWAANVSTTQTQQVASPGMAIPSPLGGGGETTPLPPVAAKLQARVREADQLGGLRIVWIALRGADGSRGPATNSSALGPGDAYSLDVGAGSTLVGAALFDGEPSPGNLPVAVFLNPVRAQVVATWEVTGTVQPMKPQSPVPATGARDAMVDKYTMDIPPGSHVTAKTAFRGAFAPINGGDVDLGLYDPTGVGTVCSATGGGTLPVGGGNPLPDAAQATESIDVTLPSHIPTGAWSVQVGAMLDGCKDAAGAAVTFFYINLGPVPYTLTVTVG
jgi:hypothetical protein